MTHDEALAIYNTGSKVVVKTPIGSMPGCAFVTVCNHVAF